MVGFPKGSLEESTIALFGKAGWKITKGSRSYKPSINDPELDGRFVRAQEISRYVGWIAPMCVFPGSEEKDALRDAARRALDNPKIVKQYS